MGLNCANWHCAFSFRYTRRSQSKVVTLFVTSCQMFTATGYCSTYEMLTRSAINKCSLVLLEIAGVLLISVTNDLSERRKVAFVILTNSKALLVNLE